MRRLAAPMLGGLFTSFLMELLVYPVIFYVVKMVAMRRESTTALSSEVSSDWKGKVAHV